MRTQFHDMELCTPAAEIWCFLNDSMILEVHLGNGSNVKTFKKLGHEFVLWKSMYSSDLAGNGSDIIASVNLANVVV
jgi:hypothetical protein